MPMMSFLSSRPIRLALMVGAGVTVASIIYGIWKHRKARSVVQDLAETDQQPDHRWDLKTKLKALLQKQNVYCTDIDYVEEVIDNLIIGGSEQLQVIADFDRTMTPMKHDGKDVPSCHCVIESCENMDDEIKDSLTKLKKYYLAIEVDPTMTKEEKLPFMVEWWTKAHGIIVDASLTKADIQQAVTRANLYLRHGYSEILELLHRHDIPLLVFSAGVGDVIQQCLQQRYKLYDNIHIIANWMSFSHEGLLIGYKGDMVHIYNKNTHAVQNSDYFDNIKHRHNVILLGDSLGDLDIAEGLTNHENLLTIGYLNHHVEASLPEYMKRYDVVLADEESVELLASLLNNILASDST